MPAAPVRECPQIADSRGFSSVFEPQAFQLAIKGRAADPQFAGDFGHLAPIMGDGEADRVPFDVLKRPDITLGISERQRMPGSSDPDGDEVGGNVGPRRDNGRRRLGQLGDRYFVGGDLGRDLRTVLYPAQASSSPLALTTRTVSPG